MFNSQGPGPFPATGYGQQQQGAGFGQPQAGGFAQQQPGGFGQPQAGGFGAAAAGRGAGGFGQQQAGGFGQPQAGGFGQQQQAGGLGQPQAGGFGAAAAGRGAGGFGAPAAGGFGQQQAGGFGQPQAGGFGQQQQAGGFGAAAAGRGAGGFGAPAAGGFGQPQAGGFGAAAAGRGAGGFGAPAAGGFGQPQAGGFGQQQQAGGFGAAAAGRGAGGFGAPAAGGFGQPQAGGFGAAAAGRGAGGFGAPAAGGFGQPQAGGFGQQQQAGGFGAPAAGGFGQPQAGGFGQQQAGGFGAAAAGRGAGGFGAPAAGGFGQQQAGGFGQPQAGGFGQQQQAGAFGQPQAGGFGAAAAGRGAGGFGAPAAGGFGQPQAGGFGQQQAGGFGTNAGRGVAGGFGQPQAGGFGQPQAGGFVPQQAGGFGQPQAGGFGQQQVGGFGQPQAGGFGQPQAGGFGQQQVGGFGQPQAGGFGQPQAGGFGQQQVGGFGQPQAGGFGQPPTGGFGAPAAAGGAYAVPVQVPVVAREPPQCLSLPDFNSNPYGKVLLFSHYDRPDVSKVAEERKQRLRETSADGGVGGTSTADRYSAWLFQSSAAPRRAPLVDDASFLKEEAASLCTTSISPAALKDILTPSVRLGEDDQDMLHTTASESAGFRSPGGQASNSAPHLSSPQPPLFSPGPTCSSKDYVCQPPMEELAMWPVQKLREVHGFSIARKDQRVRVEFLAPVNLVRVELTDAIQLQANGRVIFYPHSSTTTSAAATSTSTQERVAMPPLGEGLRVRALVSVFGLVDIMEEDLQDECQRHQTQFVSFERGVWRYVVNGEVGAEQKMVLRFGYTSNPALAAAAGSSAAQQQQQQPQEQHQKDRTAGYPFETAAEVAAAELKAGTMAADLPSSTPFVSSPVAAAAAARSSPAPEWNDSSSQAAVGGIASRMHTTLQVAAAAAALPPADALVMQPFVDPTASRHREPSHQKKKKSKGFQLTYELSAAADASAGLSSPPPEAAGFFEEVFEDGNGLPPPLPSPVYMHSARTSVIHQKGVAKANEGAKKAAAAASAVHLVRSFRAAWEPGAGCIVAPTYSALRDGREEGYLEGEVPEVRGASIARFCAFPWQHMDNHPNAVIAALPRCTLALLKALRPHMKVTAASASLSAPLHPHHHPLRPKSTPSMVSVHLHRASSTTTLSDALLGDLIQTIQQAASEAGVHTSHASGSSSISRSSSSRPVAATASDPVSRTEQLSIQQCLSVLSLLRALYALPEEDQPAPNALEEQRYLRQLRHRNLEGWIESELSTLLSASEANGELARLTPEELLMQYLLHHQLREAREVTRQCIGSEELARVLRVCGSGNQFGGFVNMISNFPSGRRKSQNLVDEANTMEDEKDGARVRDEVVALLSGKLEPFVAVPEYLVGGRKAPADNAVELTPVQSVAKAAVWKQLLGAFVFFGCTPDTSVEDIVFDFLERIQRPPVSSSSLAGPGTTSLHRAQIPALPPYAQRVEDQLLRTRRGLDVVHRGACFPDAAFLLLDGYRAGTAPSPVALHPHASSYCSTDYLTPLLLLAAIRSIQLPRTQRYEDAENAALQGLAAQLEREPTHWYWALVPLHMLENAAMRTAAVTAFCERNAVRASQLLQQQQQRSSPLQEQAEELMNLIHWLNVDEESLKPASNPLDLKSMVPLNQPSLKVHSLVETALHNSV